MWPSSSRSSQRPRFQLARGVRPEGVPLYPTSFTYSFFSTSASYASNRSCSEFRNVGSTNVSRRKSRSSSRELSCARRRGCAAAPHAALLRIQQLRPVGGDHLAPPPLAEERRLGLRGTRSSPAHPLRRGAPSRTPPAVGTTYGNKHRMYLLSNLPQCLRDTHILLDAGPDIGPGLVPSHLLLRRGAHGKLSCQLAAEMKNARG